MVTTMESIRNLGFFVLLVPPDPYLHFLLKYSPVYYEIGTSPQLLCQHLKAYTYRHIFTHQLVDLPNYKPINNYLDS